MVADTRECELVVAILKSFHARWTRIVVSSTSIESPKWCGKNLGTLWYQGQEFLLGAMAMGGQISVPLPKDSFLNQWCCGCWELMCGTLDRN